MSDGLNSIDDLKVVITASTERLTSGLETAKGVIGQFANDGSERLKVFDAALGKIGTTVQAVQARLLPIVAIFETISKVADQALSRAETATAAAGMGAEFEEFKKRVDAVKDATGALGASMKNISNSALDAAKESAVNLAGGFVLADGAAKGSSDTWERLGAKIENAINATRRFIESHDRISNRSGDTLRQNIEETIAAMDKLDLKISERKNQVVYTPAQLISGDTIENLDREKQTLQSKLEELRLALMPKELPQIKLPFVELVPEELRISPEFSKLLENALSEVGALEKKAERLDMTASASARAAAEDKLRGEVMSKNIALTSAEEGALARYLDRVEAIAAANENAAKAKKAASIVSGYEDQAASAEAKAKALGLEALAAARVIEQERLRQQSQRDGLTISAHEFANIDAAIVRRVAATEAEKAFNEAKREGDKHKNTIRGIDSSLENEVAQIRAKTVALGQSAGEAARIAAEEKAFAAARRANVELTADEIARIKREAAGVGAAAEEFAAAQTRIANVNQVLSVGFRTAEKAFDQFASGTKIKGREMVESLLSDISRLIFKLMVLKPLQDSISGGISGGLSGLTGGLFGGSGNDPGGTYSLEARASGGPVNRGQPYLVGENGPEMMVPENYGRIIPNNALRGGGGGGGNAGSPVNVTLHTTIDARGAYPESIDEIKRALAAQQQSLPGRVIEVVSDARERGGL